MARHCGYCGQRGHNRRTCRDVRLAYEQHLCEQQERLASVVSNSYEEESLKRGIARTAERLGKLTGTNPVTGEDVARNRASTRKCSYCKESGHTRRTCETLKQDQEVYREATRIARATVAHRIEEAQVGIGTMYTNRTGYYSESGSWEYGTRPFIITRAALDQYTFNSSSFRFISCQAGHLNQAASQQYAETITLSTLEMLIRRTNQDTDEGTVCHPAGAMRLSEEWLAATNIVWADVAWFQKGKRQNHNFASLRRENQRGWMHDVLVQAARNTGCIPMED